MAAATDDAPAVVVEEGVVLASSGTEKEVEAESTKVEKIVSKEKRVNPPREKKVKSLPKEKKVKVPKEKKPKMAKAANGPATHPSYLLMVKEAIGTLKERTGSSQYAIAKYLEDVYKTGLPPNFKKILSIQLRNMTKQGKLYKVKNSFKLQNDVEKPLLKAPKPAVATEKKSMEIKAPLKPTKMAKKPAATRMKTKTANGTSLPKVAKPAKAPKKAPKAPKLETKSTKLPKAAAKPPRKATATATKKVDEKVAAPAKKPAASPARKAAAVKKSTAAPKKVVTPKKVSKSVKTAKPKKATRAASAAAKASKASPAKKAKK